MDTYIDVQLMTSSTPIQEYEIELKIEKWKTRHKNSYVVNTETKNYEVSHYKYAIHIIITYQKNSKIVSGFKSSTEQQYLKNYPSNYDPLTNHNLDATKGVGYVARENGKFGSFPSHDDYSDDSLDD